jgi:hypothetical protein
MENKIIDSLYGFSYHYSTLLPSATPSDSDFIISCVQYPGLFSSGVVSCSFTLSAHLIFFFIVGALIGWIVGKIKSKNLIKK